MRVVGLRGAVWSLAMALRLGQGGERHLFDRFVIVCDGSRFWCLIVFHGLGWTRFWLEFTRRGSATGRPLAWSPSGPWAGSGSRRGQLHQELGFSTAQSAGAKAEQSRWHTAADKHPSVPPLAISNPSIGKSKKRAIPDPSVSLKTTFFATCP